MSKIKINDRISVFLKLFAICLLLVSCNTNSLNNISTRIVKNEITGKGEEYRLIKIYEDEKNDYFLEVRIPDGYNDNEARFGKEAFVYEFFKKSEEHQMLKRSVFTIGKIYLTKPSEDSLSRYADIRDFYFLDNFQVNFRERKVDDWDDVEDWRPRSISILYEYDCPKIQTFCLHGEEGVFALKIFEGKTLFWTVEYIAPVVPLPTYRSKEEVLKASRDIIENCCKIIAIKKIKES